MFCPSCGIDNPEGQANCVRCGAPLNLPYRPPKPNNYLVWSIITTILCCLIGGIIAIVYSTKVDGKYYAGDFAGAEADSRASRGWNIGSMIVGGLFNLIYIGALVVGALSEMK